MVAGPHWAIQLRLFADRIHDVVLIRARRQQIPEEKVIGPAPWTPPWEPTDQPDLWQHWLGWSQTG
eukprot:2966906-Amphidinium_carterae.1